MDDDDDYPQFGNAYPTTAPPPATNSAAAWNPALRSDNKAPEPAQTEPIADPTQDDDDFFDRYPGATPKKHQPQPTMLVADAEQEGASDAESELSVDRRHSISVQHVIDIRQSDASPEDLQRGPESSAQIEGPWKHPEHDEDEDEEAALVDGASDDEAAVFAGPEESAREQEQHLEQRMPDVEGAAEATQEVEDGVEQEDHAAVRPGHAAAYPEEGYEHQGEVTEMEAAQDEEPAAPLLDDEEAPPTPGNLSREPTFGLDGDDSPQHPASWAQAAPPPIDRSFTTNFTEVPPVQNQSEEQPVHNEEAVHDDWPSAGDDETFGELLDDEPYAPAQAETRERPHGQLPTHDWPTHDDDTFSALLDSQVATSPKHVREQDAAAQGLGDVAAPDGAAESTSEPREEDLAAAWQAALDDDDLLDESNDLDPSKFFGDDDEGLLEEDDFLKDEPNLPVPTQSQQQQARNVASQYRPANTQQPTPQQSPYVASADQFLPNQIHGRSAGTPDTGLSDLYNFQQPAPVQQQPKIQRPGIQQAQSFADKAKGGYQSPYDLPMDVAKPRRRPAQAQQTSAQVPAPPPRSSSYGPTAQPSPQLQQGPPPRALSTVSNMSPPTSSHGPPTANGTLSARTTPMTDSGFFADLPMKAKTRARPSGAYTPQPGMQSPAIGGPQDRSTGSYSSGLQPSTPGAAQGIMGPPQPHASRAPPAPAVQPPQQRPVVPSTTSQQQVPVYAVLRQPERMPLLPDQSTAQPFEALATPPTATNYSASSANSAAAGSNRYSPAPVATTQPTASRYSPAPASHPGQKRQPSAPLVGPPGAKQPFAPRTSSPLAYNADKPQPPLSAEALRNMTTSPPTLNGAPPAVGAGVSPERKTSRYSPAEQPATQTHAPPPMASQGPPRPRTQSPGATMKQPRLAMAAIERPTSAAGVYAPTSSFTQPLRQPTQPTTMHPKTSVLPHRRQFSRDLGFAAPQDERSQDPLERWKGHAIFQWTAGGTMVTSFPRQIPFYAAGHAIPSIRCTPGDVMIQDANTSLPLDDRDVKFPGPLTARSKGRKKDVLAWMIGKIEGLERDVEGAMLDFNLPPDLKKRSEEKSVLWKIMRVFVEHDGVLEGNPKIEEELRRIVLPNLAQMSHAMDLQNPLSATAVQAEVVDTQVLAQLRHALLEGQRERAVWLAEEKKLWGHAMLLASTMGPDVWKQIVQSFVRSQVKSVASADSRSLAALYQVFAGNSEDCVDELVPPSARAGFQMVNKADGSVSGNPLDGLDQWRETLGLIISNRTANDGQGLLALGKLLAAYGRVEAAHTCYLFARSIAKHSGADDAEAHFTLLGASNSDAGVDVDSILLTEIYEWSSSLSAASTTVPYIPHLQAYKLLHAHHLAAHGFKTKAGAYCDHITSAYQSTTRPSQYYHPTFTTAVSDLSAFLSQTPQTDGKSGLLGRDMRNKVSSGAASWFTKFVSGEDDHDSNGSGAAGVGSEETGPFGRVSGEISRSASVTDLYNPMMMGGVVPGAPPMSTPGAGPASAFGASSGAAGRYAPSSSYGGAAVQNQTPGNRYAPHQQTSSPALSTGLSPQEGGFMSPTDVTRSLGVPSHDQQQRPSSARSSSSRYAPMQAGQGVGVQHGLGVPRPDMHRAATDYGVPYASASRRGSAQDPGSVGSYEPTPSLAQEQGIYGDQQQPIEEGEDAFAEPNGVAQETADFEPDAEAAADGYAPPTTGYEPPSSSGYEPPSYQPYQAEPDSPEETAPQRKKKGIMDLDDDADDALAQRAASLKKAQADRAADEAFRKAVEADAARDQQQIGGKKAGGWFGGWLGGKKDPSAELNKPIRAKLGEESSFYYDEQLKKWVNKKGGTEAATPAAATPPPPRGPPSRVTSATAAGLPRSGPPSRAASATGVLGSRPPTSGSIGPPAAPGSGPPSRAATPSFPGPPESAGLPSSVTALNGDGSALPSGPPSRPSTSMSTASSLDDLLGAGPPGGGRKAGTLKGKKKGGRYIDVMAK